MTHGGVGRTASFVAYTLLLGGLLVLPGRATPASEAEAAPAAAPPTADSGIAFTDDRDKILTAGDGGPPSEPSNSAFTSDPATIHGGEVSDNASSSDPEQTFISTRDNANGEVYVTPTGYDKAVRVTCDEATKTHPVLSPDGTQVAFSRSEDPSGHFHIVIATLPDFGSSEPPDSVCADVASSTLQGGAASADDVWPSWLPDGNGLVFSSTRDNPLGDIYEQRLDASTATRVTNGRGAVANTEPSLAGTVEVTPDATEFGLPSPGGAPWWITTGPDGNLWFTEYFGNRIGRITPTGTITEYGLPSADSRPRGITPGPDGNLWFTEYFGNRIGRITPAGTITEYAAGLSANSFPTDITPGPDGNLWFTETVGNRIGRITPGGTITEYTLPSADSRPGGITAGRDGNLWFTENGRIGRITPTGIITEYNVGAGNSGDGITAGPDGNVWFTGYLGDRIGRITPAGTITEYDLTAGSGPEFIVTGPDGNLWFTESNGDRIGRITPRGTVSEYTAGIAAGSGPRGITTGPDGSLWITEFQGNRVGRVELPRPTPVLLLTTTKYRPDGSLGVITLPEPGDPRPPVLSAWSGVDRPPQSSEGVYVSEIDEVFYTTTERDAYGDVQSADATIPSSIEASDTTTPALTIDGGSIAAVSAMPGVAESHPAYDSYYGEPLFTARAITADVSEVRADGSGRSTLDTEEGRGDTSAPAYSPDGTKIADSAEAGWGGSELPGPEPPTSQHQDPRSRRSLELGNAGFRPRRRPVTQHPRLRHRAGLVSRRHEDRIRALAGRIRGFRGLPAHNAPLVGASGVRGRRGLGHGHPPGPARCRQLLRRASVLVAERQAARAQPSARAGRYGHRSVGGRFANHRERQQSDDHHLVGHPRQSGVRPGDGRAPRPRDPALPDGKQPVVERL